MKGSKTMRTIAVLSVIALAAVAVAEMPPVPPTPAAVSDVVYVRPFELANGFSYTWNQERPTVTSGTLLVLKVSDKNLVLPRQMPEPVLYVGDSTAQRINSGYESGYVVALVPGEVDLATAPIWFGTPELPERVSNAMVGQERAKATAAGIGPVSKATQGAAQARGGAALQAEDLSALLRTEVAELILEYSPQEKDLADGFRVPVVKLPGR